MKKTLIALTALVAATVGFQAQAEAGHYRNNNSGVQFELQFGNGSGITIGNGFTRVHQPYGYNSRRHRPNVDRYGYKKPNKYNRGYGYQRPYVCNIAGKRAVRRSLRARGFYDIRRIRQIGKIYKAKATSPRGYRVKLKVNGCNLRIVKRKIIRNYSPGYSPGYSYGNAWRTYW